MITRFETVKETVEEFKKRKFLNIDVQDHYIKQSLVIKNDLFHSQNI